jgi:hypothetical protein
MTMSPEFTILADSDLDTSRSENPAGVTTNDFEVTMPTLTSNPSFIRTYELEALKRSDLIMLTIHAVNSARDVHAVTGTIGAEK